jgi:hypothetical protein
VLAIRVTGDRRRDGAAELLGRILSLRAVCLRAADIKELMLEPWSRDIIDNAEAAVQ